MRAALLLATLVFACGPGKVDPTAKDAADYFGLKDGMTLTFASAGGVTQTHTIERDTSIGQDREIFRRTVRKNGFVDDDNTVIFEATLDGLFIVRFSDCIGRCGTPAAPFPVFDFPVRARAAKAAEEIVSITENGVEVEQRLERHSFQAGTFDDVTTIKGDTRAVDVVWTRTIGEDNSTVSFTFAEDVGTISLTDASGTTFNLTEVTGD